MSKTLPSRFQSIRLACLAVALVLSLPCFGQDLQPLALPKPQTDGGKPLMEVLKNRQSAREFSSDKLPLQVVSNLLWAAWGVNRPDGRRTAPSAVNWQEIELYVAMPEGIYLYDAPGHSLKPVVGGDHRSAAGQQPFVAQAPLNLIYVADTAKVRNMKPEDALRFMAADAGFIGQNVYLFCASEGLATVFRGMVDGAGLTKLMKLRSTQQVLFAQTVGYPRR